MGVETFDQVVSVRLVDSDGELHQKTPAELEIHYRSVPSLSTNYVLAATFRGKPGTPTEIQHLLEASSAKRKHSQPIAASAGCIFKNPSADCPAGKLVQELGLKNTGVGAARVSEVHGNFIVNDGGKASAGEVLALIETIKRAALETRGIVMETEVQIVGQD
jgi:UDP-N-acetylenolpyruvoylglucosamine reductase